MNYECLSVLQLSSVRVKGVDDSGLALRSERSREFNVKLNVQVAFALFVGHALAEHLLAGSR